MVEAFPRLTAAHYRRTSPPDESLEPGFEKLALYGFRLFYTHAARQLPNGKWTSKLGKAEDIEHDSPEDPIYLGKAMEFVREHRSAWDNRWPLQNVTNLMGIRESVLGEVVPHTVALIGTLREHPGPFRIGGDHGRDGSGEA